MGFPPASGDGGDDVASAESAVSIMVDLACEMWGHDLSVPRMPSKGRGSWFPMRSAMWQRRRQQDPAEFVRRAPEQLLRWESPSGWTRHGEGWTAERETTLAQVAAELLTTPDMWLQFVVNYIDVYNQRTQGATDERGPEGFRDLSRRMGHWHNMLRERLAGFEDEHVLDGLP